MAAADTPYEDRINWHSTPLGGEGKSRFGRYVYTRHKDGTIDVVFISLRGAETVGQRMSSSEAYGASVEHNKKLLETTGGGSESGTAKRRQDPPVCLECHTTHNGECL